MAEKILRCCKCKVPDDVWSFKTSAMRNKIYLCWTHLQEAESKCAERGETNLFNSK